MCITDLKYGTSLVSVFSHIAAQSYTLLCKCVPTVRSYRAQVLAVLLLCFPCRQMEQGSTSQVPAEWVLTRREGVGRVIFLRAS